MQPAISVRVELAAENLVGESATWSSEEGALYWVDISGKRVERYEPSTQRHDRWMMPGLTEAIALRQKGGAILAIDNRVCLFDFTNDPQTLCIPEPDRPLNRLNEGVCDPSGRFWVGSMQSNMRPDGSPVPITTRTGAIYRIDPDGTVERADEQDYGISNTMAWRRDGIFLFGDTMDRTIYAFDYEAESGAISRRRIFARTDEPGGPDGSCLDDNGYLWNTRYGGSALIRYAPNGVIDRIVRLPVTNATSCAFGGPNLATLFVTSARDQLSRQAIIDNPIEGALLALDVGVRGLPAAQFAG